MALLSSEAPITVMDGSMGRQLCLDGMPQDDLFRQIWSARALVDVSLHHMVVDAHKSYIEAGATLLITNAYGVQPTFYRRAFPDDWETKMLRDAELAAQLAVRAREESGASKKVRIFGCLPPLSESHRPDAFVQFLANEGKDFIVQTYRNLAKAALRGGCDALFLENLVSLDEAKLGIEAVKDLGVSLIVSMEGALRDVERNPHPERAPEVAECILEAKRAGAPIEALGFSCTEPETILSCLEALESAPGVREALKAAGVKLSTHANLNDRKEAHKKGFDVRTDKSQAIRARGDLVYDGFGGYIKFCHAFIKKGAEYVGGCCGCGPLAISSMSKLRDGKGFEHDTSTSTRTLEASVTVVRELAPTGVLRVGINLANTLLVKSHNSARHAEGIVPALATELARLLGVDVRYIPFASPGELADAVDADRWDVAFLAADAKRAATIAFSPPYVEIPSGYLKAQGSPITSLADVDKAGVRIASFAGTGYDNWLTKNIVHATLVRASSRAGAVELLSAGQADVLAGVREHLLEDAKKAPGAALLDGAFMSAAQSVGWRHGVGLESSTFLKSFVVDITTSGLLQTLLERDGADGKLEIARPSIERKRGVDGESPDGKRPRND